MNRHLFVLLTASVLWSACQKKDLFADASILCPRSVSSFSSDFNATELPRISTGSPVSLSGTCSALVESVNVEVKSHYTKPTQKMKISTPNCSLNGTWEIQVPLYDRGNKIFVTPHFKDLGAGEMVELYTWKDPPALGLVGPTQIQMNSIHVVEPGISASNLQKIYQTENVQLAFSKGEGVTVLPDDLYEIRVNHRAAINRILSLPDVTSLGSVEESLIVRMPESRVSEVSGILHEEGKSACGGLTWIPPVTQNQQNLSDSHLVDPLPAPNSASAQVQPLLGQVVRANIQSVVNELGAFTTRYHSSTTATASHNALMTRFQSIAPDLQVQPYNHTRTPQRSIIATIPGRDLNKIVILGAHIDSTRSGGYTDLQLQTLRAPGQDDDASGVASMIEALRVIKQSGIAFERTLQFVGYAAEEFGLVGSDEIAQDYASRGVQVEGVMQLDMTGYIQPGGPLQVFLFENDSSSVLNEFTGGLVAAYLGVPWSIRSFTAGSSDHKSWNRRGFRATFPFEDPDAYNTNLHTTDDVASIMNFDLSVLYSKLAIAFMVTMGVPVGSTPPIPEEQPIPPGPRPQPNQCTIH